MSALDRHQSAPRHHRTSRAEPLALRGRLTPLALINHAGDRRLLPAGIKGPFQTSKRLYSNGQVEALAFYPALIVFSVYF